MKNAPDFWKQLYDRIDPCARLGFLIALAVGCATHGFMIMNKLSSHDDLTSVPSVGGGAQYGRYMQHIVHDFFSNWSAPGINGFMAIFLLAVAAGFVVSLLRIRTKTAAVLTGLILITFPSVTSNLYFMYLAPTFSFAILLSTVGVWLTVRFRYGFLAGALLQFVSLGCYQAYFAYMTALFVLLVFLAVADDVPVRDCVISGCRALGALVLSLALYLISLRLLPFTLSDYKGIGQIGEAAPSEYLRAVLRAYHRILQYFALGTESWLEGVPARGNRLLVIVLALLLLWHLYRTGCYKQPARLLLFAGTLFLLPLAMALTYVMAPDTSHASTVMTYAYVVFYLLIIALYDRMKIPVTEHPLHRGAPFLAGAACVLLLLQSYAHFRVDTAAYYVSFIAQQRVVNYCNRILARLESEDGYAYGDPVAILGSWDPEPMPLRHPGLNAERYYDLEGFMHEDMLFLQPVRAHLMKLYTGVDVPYLSSEDEAALLESREFAAMPVYPAAGSIKKINGIWVVRTGPVIRE